MKILKTDNMDETVNILNPTLTVEKTTQERIKPSTWKKNKKFKNVTTKADKSASPMPLWMEKELQKLRKSIRLEMKRLKSEKAKSITASIAHTVKLSEIINLDTHNEPDTSVISYLAVADSTDEENAINDDNKNNKTVTLEDAEGDEKNVDKEDNQIKCAAKKIFQNTHSDATSFIKTSMFTSNIGDKTDGKL